MTSERHDEALRLIRAMEGFLEAMESAGEKFTYPDAQRLRFRIIGLLALMEQQSQTEAQWKKEART